MIPGTSATRSRGGPGADGSSVSSGATVCQSASCAPASRSGWSGTRCSQPRDTSTSPTPAFTVRTISASSSPTQDPDALALVEALDHAVLVEQLTVTDAGVDVHPYVGVAGKDDVDVADTGVQLGADGRGQVAHVDVGQVEPQVADAAVVLAVHWRRGPRRVGPVAAMSPRTPSHGTDVAAIRASDRTIPRVIRPPRAVRPRGEGRGDQAESDHQQRGAEEDPRADVPAGRAG